MHIQNSITNFISICKSAENRLRKRSVDHDKAFTTFEYLPEECIMNCCERETKTGENNKARLLTERRKNKNKVYFVSESKLSEFLYEKFIVPLFDGKKHEKKVTIARILTKIKYLRKVCFLVPDYP